MKDKQTKIPDPADLSVDSVIADIENLEIADKPLSRGGMAIPPEGKRYIMTVKSYNKIIASDWINAKLTNDAVIALTGEPSPSSAKDFKLAYLRFFVSKNRLRLPRVIQRPGLKILNIWYPIEYLATVERTLKKANATYCWIGNFGNSSKSYVNMHADIHANF